MHWKKKKGKGREVVLVLEGRYRADATGGGDC